MLIDTHCHIHDVDYPLPIAEVEARAAEAGVAGFVCVGTDAETSRAAVRFVQNRPHAWASIGLHPHDADLGEGAFAELEALLPPAPSLQLGAESPRPLAPPGGPKEATPQNIDQRAMFVGGAFGTGPVGVSVSSAASSPPGPAEKAPKKVLSTKRLFGVPSFGPPGGAEEGGDFGGDGSDGAGKGETSQKIVAIGECGLDYFYTNASKPDQEKALRFQIELALRRNLPLIFHVRDAFDDFWPIFDQYRGIRGVVHSFTDTQENLDQLLSRNLSVGVNGIMTFTKNQWQLDMVKNIPQNRLLLETDAPYLTPVPFRGKVNEPAHVRTIATFLAQLRGETPDSLAQASTHNARQLFSLT